MTGSKEVKLAELDGLLDGLHEGVDGNAEARLGAWLEQSPENAQLYLERSLIDAMVNKISPLPAHEPPKTEDAPSQSTGTHAAEAPPTASVTRIDDVSIYRHTTRPQKRSYFRSAAALLIVAAGLAGMYRAYALRWHDYQSGNESRVVSLSDGSTVRLDPDSTMRVRILTDRREVRPLRGGLRLDVHTDPEKPFSVFIPGGELRVLGTQFSTVRRDGQYVVSVYSGAVALKSAKGDLQLSAGLTSTVDDNGTLGAAAALARANPDAGPGTFHAFNNETVATAAAEFNRENPDFYIEVKPSAATVRFTANSNLHDPQGWLSVLEREGAVNVAREPGFATVTSAN